MKHWSADFIPQSLCSYGDGDGGGGGGGGGGDQGGDQGGPDGDQGGYYSGDAGSYGTGYDTDTSSLGGTSTSGPDSDQGGYYSGSADSYGTGYDSDGGGGPGGSTGGGQGTGGPDSGGPDSSGGPGPDGDTIGGSQGTDFADFQGGPGSDMLSDIGQMISSQSVYGGLDDVGYDLATGGWGQGYGVGNVAYGMNPGSTQGVGPTGQGTGPFGAFDFSDPDPQDPGYGPGPQQSQTGGLNAPMSLDDLNAIQTYAPGFQAPTADPMGTPNYSISPGAPNVAPEAPSTAPGTQGFNLGDIFGISQAQAAPAPSSTSTLGLNSAFDQLMQESGRADPNLANALNNYVTNYNATNLAAPGQLGPNISPFDQPSPSAQPGFTGMSPAQTSQGQFTGQASAFSDPSVQGKGDRGATEPTAQSYPGAQQAQAPNPSSFNIDPVAPAQGWPSTPTFDPQTTPAQTIAQDFEALQGKGPAPTSPTQQDLEQAFQQLQEQAQTRDMQQAEVFDQQSKGEQGKGAPYAGGPAHFNDTFGQFGPQQESRSGPQHEAINDPNYFDPNQFNVTVGLAPNQDVISNLVAASRGVGQEPPSGPNPGFYSTQTGGRSSQSGPGFGPFTGEQGGRSSSQQSGGRSSSQGGRSSDPGGRSSSQGGRASYYATGGPGIAPGALGFEKGGIYGLYGPTGIPGTNSFGGQAFGARGGVGPQSSLMEMYLANLFG